ncbi:MAG: class I SAM-dependent methyltransferase [Patescibacteria group bacterium]
MKIATIKQLNQLSLDFYEKFAHEFAGAREYYWSGWQKLLSIINKHLPNQPNQIIRVMDVGCGHGRLASFFAENLPPKWQVQYTGLDNSQALLKLAKTRIQSIERFKTTAQLKYFDLMTLLLDNQTPLIDDQQNSSHQYDLICLFGIFHHVPSLKLRHLLIHQLLSQLSAHGLLIITFWDFANFDRFQKKIIDPHTVKINPQDLEANDYILDWQKGGTAYRYCHHTTQSEIEQLLNTPSASTPFIKAKIVDSFGADGREQTINRYLVLALADQM